MSELNQEVLSKAATVARGLAIDAVHACQSGHLGLPLGCAEIGAVLYGHALVHAPQHPQWLNRDRFVLSAGHGSMFLYGWLHLSGYSVSDRGDQALSPARLQDARAPGADARARRRRNHDGSPRPRCGQRGGHGRGGEDGGELASTRRSRRSSITTSSASPATDVCKKASPSKRSSLPVTSSSTTSS